MHELSYPLIMLIASFITFQFSAPT